jgi:hypothetical protein
MAIKTTHYPSGKTRRCGIVTKGAIGTHRHLVGGLNECKPTLGDHVFNMDTHKTIRKNITQAKRDKYNAFLETTCIWQLWYGDSPFGKPRSMTGQEVMEKNKALELKFLHDKTPDVRMWRWHKEGALRITKGMTANEFSALKFEHDAKKDKS